ncbi:MAG: hypothetical protein ACTHJK_03595 [Sphingomicrobium sp.]
MNEKSNVEGLLILVGAIALVLLALYVWDEIGTGWRIAVAIAGLALYAAWQKERGD